MSITPQQCYPSPRHRGRPRTISKTPLAKRTWHDSQTLVPSNPRIRTHLSDILVPHSADLLDIGRTLRNPLEGVAGKNELVLLCLRNLHVNAGLHDDVPDNLLADEVTAAT